MMGCVLLITGQRFYFIALMIIGYYVLFNLLVAILVEGFTSTGVRTIILILCSHY